MHGLPPNISGFTVIRCSVIFFLLQRPSIFISTFNKPYSK
ncbi:hypothetical protein D1AOALGA4SA_3392 [Olavius algarvensis Delta 1 endosymbiont]|nr:hypothetical protein D1AOALGA4SA_3392 [Olavius algarvensis Delta 1 endosymbiont]